VDYQDASDASISNSFGSNMLVSFKVRSDEVTA